MEYKAFELHSVNVPGPWSIPMQDFMSLVFNNKDADFYFDDGLKSAYEFAVPVLETHGLKGKFAIVSSLVGVEGYMTWDDIKDLINRGHAIVNHTYTHQKLDDITFYSNIYHEVEKCSEDIYKIVDYICKEFVPPYNAYNQRVEEIVKTIGLKLVKDRIRTDANRPKIS